MEFPSANRCEYSLMKDHCFSIPHGLQFLYRLPLEEGHSRFPFLRSLCLFSSYQTSNFEDFAHGIPKIASFLKSLTALTKLNVRAPPSPSAWVDSVPHLRMPSRTQFRPLTSIFRLPLRRGWLGIGLLFLISTYFPY